MQRICQMKLCFDLILLPTYLYLHGKASHFQFIFRNDTVLSAYIPLIFLCVLEECCSELLITFIQTEAHTCTAALQQTV